MANRDETITYRLKGDGKEMLELARTVTAVGDASGEAEKEANAFLSEFADAARLQAGVERFKSLSRAVLDYEGKIRAAKLEVATLGKEISATAEPTKKQVAAFDSAKRELDKLTTTQEKQRTTLRGLRKDLEDGGVAAGNLVKGAKDLAARSAAAADGLRALAERAKASAAATAAAAAAAERSAAQIGKFRDALNSAAGSALKLTGLAGAISATLGTLGAADLFTDSIASARAFEQKLATIGAVTGATADEMTRFKKAAEDATRTTNFSASETADALLELAKASGDAAAATAQLAPTLNLAQAAGIDTAESATILTTTLTQFGLAATDAARVADVFVTEANSTEDSVSKLGNAMRYVAPLAKNLGLSLEETTVIIGALAKEGFKGETAGTALRNVFLQMTDPASKFREALRGIGITTTDMTEVFKQLIASGDKSKIALLALDAEARPAIQALVNSGGKNLDILTAAIARNGGEAERQSKKIGQSFDGAAARLRNAFDQLRRDLVEPILDPVAAQFDDLAARVLAFTQTTDFQKIADAIKSFAVQATAALIELGQNVDYTKLAAQIETFATEATAFFVSLKDNASATLDVLSAVVNGIATVFNSLQAVVLSAATIITGVLTGIAAAALKTAEALARLPGAGEALKGTVEELRDVVGGLAAVTEDFAARAAANFDETGAAAARFGKNIQDISDAAATGAPQVENLGDAATTAVTKVETLGNELKLATDWTAEASEKFRLIPGPLGDAQVAADAAAASVENLGEQAKQLAERELLDAQDRLNATSLVLAELTRAGQQNAPVFEYVQQQWGDAARKLEALRTSAKGAAIPADELAQAYKNLGVVSQQELSNAAKLAQEDFEKVRAAAGTTAEGINKTREAFVAYARAQLAAVASSDAATKAQTENTLRQLAAQVQAIEQFDQLTKTQETSGKVAEDAGRKVVRAGETGARALDQVQDSAKNAEKEIKAAGKTAEAVTVSFEGIGRASFKAVADLYSLVLARKASVAELTIEIQRAQERLTQQQGAVDAMVASYSNLDDAAAAAMTTAAGGADRAAANLQAMANQARAGATAFDELDQSQLNNLAAAAEAAAAKVQEIADKAREAKDALRGMADSAQDEIDRLRGNEVAIEDRRFQERIRQIKEEAALAGAAGAEEAQRAIANEELLHQLRMANLLEEQAQRNQPSTPAPNTPSPATPRPGNNSGGGTGNSGPPVIINIQGNVIGNEAYTRQLSKDLQKLWGRGG